MGIAALLLSIVGLAACVAIAPHRIPPVIGMTYWAVRWIGQSLALPLAIVAAGMAGWALAEGWPGSMLASLLAIVPLAVAHRRNRRVARLMLDAAGLAAARVPLAAGLWPFASTRGTRRLRDVAYADGSKRNRLDLVLPRTPPAGPMPILLHIHGGAWIAGAKNQQARPLLTHMARRGWLCVDIGYRLAPRHRLPAMIGDVRAAIAWVKAHARDHGGDPGFVAITGGSAGGHLAALAALTPDNGVAAALLCYGRFDLLDRACRMGRQRRALLRLMTQWVMPASPAADLAGWRAASPIDQVRRDAPPMLLLHGTGDSMIDAQESRDFAKALGDRGGRVELVALPHLEHAYDIFASAATYGHVRLAEAFLTRQWHAATGERT